MSAVQEADRSSRSTRAASSMAIFQQLQAVEQDAKQIDELISVMLTMEAEWSVSQSEFEEWLRNLTDYRGEKHSVGFVDAGEVPCFLNCWEAILYAASQAGLVSRHRLSELISDPRASQTDAAKILNLAGARPLRLSGGLPTNVQKGQILFFHGTSHVAVATDSVGNVIQLWSWSGRTRTATFQELFGAMSQTSQDNRVSFLIRYLSDSEAVRKEALEISGVRDFQTLYNRLSDAEEEPQNFPEAVQLFQQLWARFCGPLPINGETEQVMVSTPIWG